jgi:hypothetical protein
MALSPFLCARCVVGIRSGFAQLGKVHARLLPSFTELGERTFSGDGLLYEGV